jgi:oligopeptidase B
VLRSNWRAPNHRLLTLDDAQFDAARAADSLAVALAGACEQIAHDPAGMLHDFETFRLGIAAEQRVDGLCRVRFYPWRALTGADDPPPLELTPVGGSAPAGAACLTGWLGDNEVFDTGCVRCIACSPTTPATVYEFDLLTGESRTLKSERVCGGYDPAAWAESYCTIHARDGAEIPVSIVRPAAASGPLAAASLAGLPCAPPALFTAYGAYGISQDPLFSSARLSLLERGFTIVTVHVRGGQERGRAWYDAGREINKETSFDDFLDAIDALVASGEVDHARVFAEGASAGGLLVCAAANRAPDRFRGVFAIVPFVDVLTSMLDPDLPLTETEYDEWGDPRRREHYDAIRRWSPYDNVRAQAYPCVYVAAGLFDSQVPYWEPAKFVARLRDRTTGAAPILLRMDLDAGHAGAAGRWRPYRETAERWALMLDLAGLADGPDRVHPPPPSA